MVVNSMFCWIHLFNFFASIVLFIYLFKAAAITAKTAALATGAKAKDKDKVISLRITSFLLVIAILYCGLYFYD